MAVDQHFSDAPASRLEAIRRIRALERIPPPPREQRRLLTAVADPDVEVRALAELIESCPPVAARIVAVARSAFFATGAPVRDVRDAVMRVLGLRLVADLVNCMALSTPLQVRACGEFEPARFWFRAVSTATIAQRLAADATQMDPHSRRSVYLCGLLHNLGLLVLVHLDPDGMSQIFRALKVQATEALNTLEVEHLGISHHEAGGRLAAAWGLPPEIQAVMFHHGEPEYHGEHWKLSRLVGASSRLAPVLLHADSNPSHDVPDLDAIGLDSQAVVERLAELSNSVEALSEFARELT